MSKPISKLRKAARADVSAIRNDEDAIAPSETTSYNLEDASVEANDAADTGESDEVKIRKRKRKRKSSAIETDSVAEKKAVETVAEVNLDNSAFVNSRTVYIEGLPFTATDTQVNEYFRQCGKVISIRLPRWHDSGRLRGYGHVEFATDAAAAKAFELDGCDFLDSGRYLKIARPMAPRALQQSQTRTASSSEIASLRPPGCKTVFVKNLPYDVTDESVRSVFQVCGPVINVRLAVWGHTQQLKGFGYVEFKREDCADIAVKKSGILAINGRPLIVDYEGGVPKGSFKAPMKKTVDSISK